MDVLIENVVKELSKKKKLEIDEKGKKKIYTNFPIPREHEILWGDNKAEKSKKYGLVITNIGFFIRENPKNLNKKDKSNSYYYFKWEYFNLEDFKLKRNSKGGIDLILIITKYLK